MDQRGEKEEHNSEDSTDHGRKDDVDAVAEGDMNKNNHEEAEETAGVLKDKGVEVVGGSEEITAPLLAHPCSLLHLLLRACAGCLGLRGYCSADDDPRPAAAAADVPAAASAGSTQEGDQLGGGDKAASYLCTQEVVVTQVRAVRTPTPPGSPREGPGGDGGKHN